jgi:hypothetical protein
MSRDAFSYAPQNARDTTHSRSPRHRPAPLADARDARGVAAGTSDRPLVSEARTQHCRSAERDDSPRAYSLRDRTYLLRDSEIHSLTEIGKFRVIAATDLTQYAYQGDRERIARDVRHLRSQGLLAENTIEISQKKLLRVVTLTKAGHRLLSKTNQISDEQAFYHGLREPRGAKHNADLYRIYQKEAARIEGAGGRRLRVILDYELKRNVNRDLALPRPDQETEARRHEIATRHGLKLVNGKILVPDLRIEYESAELEIRHIDLELATREYRPKALAAKAAAGFSLYSRPEDAPRLRRILDERKLPAGILTL